MERFGDYLHSGPNAYPDNFLPPHTDQFYPTDIPMYYDEDHRFNIDRALSKEDVLKQHPSYPYLDTSKVTFGDISESAGAHYRPSEDLSVLNLKYTDPQNITARDLESVGHETVHRTADPFHGIPEVRGLLDSSIEPFVGSYHPEGPKHSYVWPEEIKDVLDPSENVWKKTEHLLNYAIQNEAYPESTQGELWNDFFPSNYNRAFTQEIADESKYYRLPGIGTRKYYPPRDAFLGNAPGEVIRGIMGLKDSFRHAALKYKNIMKNYANRRRQTPRAQQRQAPDEGLGDAGIAERIAAENRAKKAAIQEAVNIQIGTSRGGDIIPTAPKKKYVAPPRGGGADVFNMPVPPPKKKYVAPLGPRGDGNQRSMPTGTSGRNPFNYRAHGGLIDIPLPGRSRYI